MGVLSPDEKFLLVGTTFDLPIAISGAYPDGSPILWVPGQTANSDLLLRMRGIPMVAIGMPAWRRASVATVLTEMENLPPFPIWQASTSNISNCRFRCFKRATGRAR
jgi:hypothetical protein